MNRGSLIAVEVELRRAPGSRETLGETKRHASEQSTISQPGVRKADDSAEAVPTVADARRTKAGE